MENSFAVRAARTADVRKIRELVADYVSRRILLGKNPVGFFEGLQQFLVAEQDGQIVGCGALHVLWEDLAEIRTLAVAPHAQGSGVGAAIVRGLLDQAQQLGVSRVFCLTFEVEFFAKFGFEPIDDSPVTPEVFGELVRSYDEGTAEFLDLERVKPNTLGNTRMLLRF